MNSSSGTTLLWDTTLRIGLRAILPALADLHGIFRADGVSFLLTWRLPWRPFMLSSHRGAPLSTVTEDRRFFSSLLAVPVKARLVTSPNVASAAGDGRDGQKEKTICSRGGPSTPHPSATLVYLPQRSSALARTSGLTMVDGQRCDSRSAPMRAPIR